MTYSKDRVFATGGDFRKTRTYLGSDSARRKRVNEYRAEYGLGDEQTFLLLYLNDLKHEITPEEKKKANGPGETTVVFAIILAVAATAMRQPIAIFVATALLIVMTILFVTGRFNSYETEKRRVRRLLKAYGPVPEFDEWEESHSSGINNRSKG